MDWLGAVQASTLLHLENRPREVTTTPHGSERQSRIWVRASLALEALSTGPRTPRKQALPNNPRTTLGDKTTSACNLWSF